MTQSQLLLRKLDGLNEENEKLKKENEDLQVELDNERSLSATNIKTQAAVDELEDKLKDLELTKTESDTKVKKLESELSQLKTELTHNKSELDKARTDLESKQQHIESYETELEVLRSQQNAELAQKGILESQKTEFQRTLAAKDDEMFKINTQLQQNEQLLSELRDKIMREERELQDLKNKLYTKDIKIDELTNQVSKEISQTQSFENVISDKDKELKALNHNYTQSKEQNAKLNDVIQQLQTKADQRMRKAEENKHNEVQKLTREIANLNSSIASYKNRLSERESELQRSSKVYEQLLNNFGTLQKRLKSAVAEKHRKESELTQELEDSVSTLDNSAIQLQQARIEISTLKHSMTQKDEEIQQVIQREQSAQEELKARAEKTKAHEKMITELREKNNDYQKQLKEFEAKCERLEGEVNRVNAHRLSGKISREHTADEIGATNARHGTPEQQKFERHGSGSDPYHAAPLNQNLGQYHQRRYTEGSRQTPNRYSYQEQQQERRGYDLPPGPPTPPANQGQPYGNMMSPPGNQLYGNPPGHQINPHYQPSPMNQPAGRYQQPQDQPFRHSGPLQGNIGVELNSDPCPMCQRRFANNFELAQHAATCNYDADNH